MRPPSPGCCSSSSSSSASINYLDHATDLVRATRSPSKQEEGRAHERQSRRRPRHGRQHRPSPRSSSSPARAPPQRGAQAWLARPPRAAPAPAAAGSPTRCSRSSIVIAFYPLYYAFLLASSTAAGHRATPDPVADPRQPLLRQRQPGARVGESRSGRPSINSVIIAVDHVAVGGALLDAGRVLVREAAVPRSRPPARLRHRDHGRPDAARRRAAVPRHEAAALDRPAPGRHRARVWSPRSACSG